MPYTHINRVVYALGRFGHSGVDLIGAATMLPNPGTFATAAHVTNKDDQNLVVVIKIYTSINSYQDTSDPKVHTLPVKIKEIDPFSDICILSSGSDATSNIKITNTDNIKVGENINIFGYPHADHGRLVLTHQKAEIGAKILISTENIKSKHIVLNIQTRPGQSGSPIFSSKDGSLIAILIGSYAPGGGGGISLGGVDPHTLHQTTHAVSTEYLLKMME